MSKTKCGQQAREKSGGRRECVYDRGAVSAVGPHTEMDSMLNGAYF